MRPRADVLVIGVLTTAGLLALLAGCAGTQAGRSPASEPPAPAATTGPSAPAPEDSSRGSQAPTPTGAQPSVDADRMPLGLEVRFVSRDGRFVTVSPEDFAR